MLAIYQEHSKEKLHTVDQVLDKYTGKWAVMLKVRKQKWHETAIQHTTHNPVLAWYLIVLAAAVCSVADVLPHLAFC